MTETANFKIFFSFTLPILCLHFPAGHKTLHEQVVDKIWLTSSLTSGRVIAM